MPHMNYLKCKDGVPVQPMQVTLDPAYIPKETGVTWEPFDTEVMSPKTINATLVGGKVIVDSARKAAYAAEQAKIIRRHTKFFAAKESAVTRANWGAMTVAERKIAVGLVPTDAELGL